MAVKERRHDKMQQRPQFGHAVLNRSSGQQQPVSAFEPKQGLPSNTAAALEEQARASEDLWEGITTPADREGEGLPEPRLKDGTDHPDLDDPLSGRAPPDRFKWYRSSGRKFLPNGEVNFRPRGYTIEEY